MSLHPIVVAHDEGFAENMYLDPQTSTKVEETGGANFIFITKDGKLVTPKSDSILPSITRRSLMIVAEKYLGMEVEHREVLLSELEDFVECGLCGTAAVISPISYIDDPEKNKRYTFSEDGKPGPISKKLFDTLRGIQYGIIEDKHGWTRVVIG
jgi:branched-chain amino acid aminotransferase